MSPSRFHTIPDLNLKTITPTDLKHLETAVEKFNIEQMRFTSGNQLAVAGVAEHDLPALYTFLGSFMEAMPDNGISSILTCPGCNECERGLRTTDDLANRIKNLNLPQPLPAKVKVSIAGCPRCCTMPLLRDVGLFPAAGGWQLSFGGNGGRRPRIGDIIGTNLTETEAVELIKAALHVYHKMASPKMRTARLLEQIGFEEFLLEVKKKWERLTQVKE